MPMAGPTRALVALVDTCRTQAVSVIREADGPCFACIRARHVHLAPLTDFGARLSTEDHLAVAGFHELGHVLGDACWPAEARQLYVQHGRRWVLGTVTVAVAEGVFLAECRAWEQAYRVMPGWLRGTAAPLQAVALGSYFTLVQAARAASTITL